MKSALMQGWGGELFYIEGAKFVPVNSTLVADTSFTYAQGSIYGNSTWTSSTKYDYRFFNGRNTWYPGGYANHKGIATYKSKVYSALNYASPAQGHLHVGYWDGSGVFTHGGSAYETTPWRCGRGFRFLSPSGTHSIRSCDLGILVHHGNLFMAGAFWGSNIPLTWVTKYGWTWNVTAHPAGTSEAGARLYKMLAITSEGKRLASRGTHFTPVATHYNHLHTCDMVGFDHDIYYANWVDTIRFPSCSGYPAILVESDLTYPTSKCFAIWPSGGYNISTGKPNGNRTLLILHGSGVLKKVNPTNTDTLVDFTNIREFDIRDTDNFYARVNSNVNEPQRSSYLANYNSKLHAFVATATSGYAHFVCTGQPSITANWTDMTDSLPDAIKSVDGCLYGYIDEYKNKLFVAHVTWSNTGIYGTIGVNRSAGAVTIHEYNSSNNWSKVAEAILGWPPRGFHPYNNLGPHIHVPSGSNPIVYPANDYAVVEYTVYDHYKRAVDIDVEYSQNNGLSWSTARRFRDYSTRQLLGSGTAGLPTSPDGITYPFYWDYVNDVGFDRSLSCVVRVRPRLVR